MQLNKDSKAQNKNWANKNRYKQPWAFFSTDDFLGIDRHTIAQVPTQALQDTNTENHVQCTGIVIFCQRSKQKT